jgi:hypothetical protein
MKDPTKFKIKTYEINEMYFPQCRKPRTIKGIDMRNEWRNINSQYIFSKGKRRKTNEKMERPVSENICWRWNRLTSQILRFMMDDFFMLWDRLFFKQVMNLSCPIQYAI